MVLAARSIDPDTHRSVLYELKTTALLQSQEWLAYQLTRLYLNDYYLTYPGITVESEVKAALADRHNFIKGPAPLFRDSATHLDSGFCVRDKNYLSARWPGDAWRFSTELVRMLTN